MPVILSRAGNEFLSPPTSEVDHVKQKLQVFIMGKFQNAENAVVQSALKRDRKEKENKMMT
ncbi:hypothetical protein ACTXT7_001827 [Hymenolepis weldensis]